MRKNVRFKGKNNNTIVFSSGMTDKDIVEVLENRIKKRQIEIDKRQWIYDEYMSLESKQRIDKDWLSAFKYRGFTVESK